MDGPRRPSLQQTLSAGVLCRERTTLFADVVVSDDLPLRNLQNKTGSGTTHAKSCPNKYPPQILAQPESRAQARPEKTVRNENPYSSCGVPTCNSKFPYHRAYPMPAARDLNIS